jgi:tungstate transport system ATP-binding protein
MLYDIQNLVRQFGSRTVLDIDRLSFEARKIYALIGPNGAGKTTLLNQLAFLDQPTSGTLFFHNQPVQYERTSLTRLRRQVVLVDQTPILFSGTVLSNVEFGLKVRAIGQKERSIKIDRALDQVGMREFASADVYGLSGGEVKRVALARALALDPDVLLCDEPTANVDQQHQEIILKIIEQANSIRNTSVIFSTHYLSQSRRLAHETILLQNGRLSTHLEENLFNGRIFPGRSGNPVFRLADKFNLNCPVNDSGWEEEGAVQVHIVPERVHVKPCSAQRDSSLTVTGTVKSLVMQNGSIRIVVDIGELLTVIIAVDHFHENPVQIGQFVELTIPHEAIVVLP